MKFKYFLFLFIIAFGYSFAQDAAVYKCPIETILDNSEYCVRQLDENKIYFNPECLEYSEEGMKLDLDGVNNIVLSLIRFDSKGPFILQVKNEPKEGRTQVWCENCGFHHDPPPHPVGFPKPF